MVARPAQLDIVYIAVMAVVAVVAEGDVLGAHGYLVVEGEPLAGAVGHLSPCGEMLGTVARRRVAYPQVVVRVVVVVVYRQLHGGSTRNLLGDEILVIAVAAAVVAAETQRMAAVVCASGGYADGVVAAGVDGAPAPRHVVLEVLGQTVGGGDGVGDAGGGNLNRAYPCSRYVVVADAAHEGVVDGVGRQVGQRMAHAGDVHLGQLVRVGAEAVGHAVVVAVAHPCQRGRGGENAGYMYVAGCGAGRTCDVDIVHGCRRVVASAAVGNPDVHQDIVARVGDVHIALEVLPGVLGVQAMAAVYRDPAIGCDIGKVRC